MIDICDFSLCVGSNALLKNITLLAKENLAIIGKSGQGKSLFLKSLVLLLDKSYKIQAKKFQIGDYDLLQKKLNLKHLRRDFALILQDVNSSFYPYISIGDFFDIVLKEHFKLHKAQRKERVFSIFSKLRLDESLWNAYIHELSGGMARRVQIALALCLEPKVLLCDEITSSLDEKNSQNIINLLKDLKNTKLILVTHDLHLAKNLSQEIIVLEKGEIIEQTKTLDFFNNPKSSYGKEVLKLHKDHLC